MEENWREKEAEKIFNAILDVTDMAPWDLKKKTQKREVVDLKKIFTWMIFERWSLSTRDQEGRPSWKYFNETHVSEYLNVDRTTVTYYRRNAKNLISNNREFRALSKRINNAYTGELSWTEKELQKYYKRLHRTRAKIATLERRLANNG